jgi:ABC-type phosphate transport system permease subunit
MELNSMANRTNIAMKPYSTSPEALAQKPVNLRKRARPGEFIIQAFLFLCGGFSILTTIGIVYVLGRESLLFFLTDEVTLGSFSPATAGSLRS